ncbi:MAG TPA: hypothetical protein DHW71_07875 [Gammaproteobacteria bacterium]|nr:hypothetical protein [Gammaproteobacteria bacterium]HBF09316.1 hypothetical protein [Gammaproteobacteria bacterium]HCK92888.1 hypothetical protein [Gammaproteobacteria bacterium]|tara:strand:- start:3821 stop:4870 length:1050 start_codon:yes stop_codon:yes gene_type:complete
MAVYTHLSEKQVKNLIQASYGLNIVGVKPVAEGIENSIYKLDCDSGRSYAFVIFETLELALVEAYCSVFEKIDEALQAKLSDLNVQVPSGVRLLDSACVHSGSKQRHFSLMVKSDDGVEKPAVLQPWIQGGHHQPDAKLCSDLGKVLGIVNSLRPAQGVEDGIPLNQHLYRIQLVEDTLADYQEEVRARFCAFKTELKDLLSVHDQFSIGLVHGDLFADNALMETTHLTGVIDFFNASWSPRLMDLAICLMDWCVRDGKFDENLTRSLIHGFRQKCEPIPEFDLQHWADLVRLAAFRFWCTRQEYYLACQVRGIEPVANREPSYCENVYNQVSEQLEFLNAVWYEPLTV